MNVKFFATYRMIVGQGCINLPAPRDVLELLEIVDNATLISRGCCSTTIILIRDAMPSCWCAAAISSIWMACAPRFPSRFT